MIEGPAGAPPLAIYVHWPYCARICPYCDFNVVRDRGQAEQAALAAAIVRDLQGQAALTGPRELVSIFFGGGTPSLMTPDWVAQIVEAARGLWPGSPPEITLEANPTNAEADRFAGFADAGVTRLSLGVQALDDTALRFLGRNHDADEARRALELAALLFPRLSLDLIYALPGQSPADWGRELKAATEFGAEHISPYQLTIEQGTAFARAVGRGVFSPPDEETAAALYETTQVVLEAADFDAYEVSNHARGLAARSRHNLAYWRGQDYLGVGPGAHGRVTRDGARTATYAALKTADYIAAVNAAGVGIATSEVLSPRDAAIERLLLGLRIDEGVGWREIAALTLSQTHPTVDGLVEQGLARADVQGLAATRAGRAVLDSLVAALVQS